MARPQRARRGAADGHRLELPPRAPASQPALAQRRRRRRRSARTSCRGTASIWYYFREIDYPHIKEMWETGDTIAKGAAMMAGVELQPTKVLGSAWPQHLNKVVAETTWANIQKVGLPKWSDEDQQLAKALQKELKNPRAEGLRCSCRDGLPGPGAEQHRRRLRRHRRHLLERADGDAALPVEHPGPAGPQLGQRDRDGDADRAQGGHGRRQGAGDDDPGSRLAPRAGRAGVGLLPRRPDQGHEVRAAAAPAGPARDLAEQGRSWTSTGPR